MRLGPSYIVHPSVGIRILDIPDVVEAAQHGMMLRIVRSKRTGTTVRIGGFCCERHEALRRILRGLLAPVSSLFDYRRMIVLKPKMKQLKMCRTTVSIVLPQRKDNRHSSGHTEGVDGTNDTNGTIDRVDHASVTDRIISANGINDHAVDHTAEKLTTQLRASIETINHRGPDEHGT